MSAIFLQLERQVASLVEALHWVGEEDEGVSARERIAYVIESVSSLRDRLQQQLTETTTRNSHLSEIEDDLDKRREDLESRRADLQSHKEDLRSHKEDLESRERGLSSQMGLLQEFQAQLQSTKDEYSESVAKIVRELKKMRTEQTDYMKNADQLLKEQKLLRDEQTGHLQNVVQFLDGQNQLRLDRVECSTKADELVEQLQKEISDYLTKMEQLAKTQKRLEQARDALDLRDSTELVDRLDQLQKFADSSLDKLKNAGKVIEMESARKTTELISVRQEPDNATAEAGEKSSNTSSQGQVSNLKAEVAQLHGKVEEKTKYADVITKKLNEKAKEVEEKTREVDDVTRKLDEKVREVNEKTKEVAEKTKELDRKAKEADLSSRNWAASNKLLADEINGLKRQKKDVAVLLRPPQKRQRPFFYDGEEEEEEEEEEDREETDKKEWVGEVYDITSFLLSHLPRLDPGSSLTRSEAASAMASSATSERSRALLAIFLDDANPERWYCFQGVSKYGISYSDSWIRPDGTCEAHENCVQVRRGIESIGPDFFIFR